MSKTDKKIEDMIKWVKEFVWDIKNVRAFRQLRKDIRQSFVIEKFEDGQEVVFVLITKELYKELIKEKQDDNR